MRRDELSTKVQQLAFEFFFGFSRFEFALKENGYLENHKEGAPAKPGWSEFEREFQDDYELSGAGGRLLELAPERQVVTAHSGLKFIPEMFSISVLPVIAVKSARQCQSWQNASFTLCSVKLSPSVANFVYFTVCDVGSSP